jgi:hypothetical protein
MQLVFSSVLPSLRNAQNQDGGWGYRGGASWTEPTAYALLALAAAGESGEDVARGMAFLARTQRKDGGWPPHPSVDQSTWVTAMALLVLADQPGATGSHDANAWLMKQSGRESGYLHRLREWLLGVQVEENVSYSGWPWYPGTAAWVAPTALTILALEKVSRRKPDPARRARIETGREFLLSRMCRDGGWNYGSTQALGFVYDSYPETTGLALLALAGGRRRNLEKSLRCAERHLASCRSVEGGSWLEMALLAHERTPPPCAPIPPAFRSLIDTALFVVARAAAGGRNVFLS